jgi:hypothetical protein
VERAQLTVPAEPTGHVANSSSIPLKSLEQILSQSAVALAVHRSILQLERKIPDGSNTGTKRRPSVWVESTGQILQSIADIASESTTPPHYVPGRDDR